MNPFNGSDFEEWVKTKVFGGYAQPEVYGQWAYDKLTERDWLYYLGEYLTREEHE